MKSKDLNKRILTSIPLIFLLGFSFYSYNVLIITLILTSLISFFEFQNLTSKIFKKNNLKSNIYKSSVNILSTIFLVIFSFLIFSFITDEKLKLYILYLFSICILSDIGGLIFGKIFKGKKLTKISPSKTISGSIGSFILSLLSAPIFYFLFEDKFLSILSAVVIAILVSFFCQLGDLFISFMKRKAKVKDTGNILPGHGGILDRIDGMLLALPLGIIILEIYLN